MNKHIQLTQGQVAIVCDCHAHLVEGHKWYAAYHDKVKSFYAMRKLSKQEQKEFGRVNVLMHQVIAGTPTGLVTHHVNHQTLDNRCSNLQVVTATTNKQLRKDNASGYIGVTWHKRDRKWMAQIMVNGKHKVLGVFADIEQAARTYDEAALEAFGSSCTLNFTPAR